MDGAMNNPFDREYYYDIVIARLPAQDVHGQELLPQVKDYMDETSKKPKMTPTQLEAYKDLWKKYPVETMLEPGTDWMADEHNKAEAKLQPQSVIL